MNVYARLWPYVKPHSRSLFGSLALLLLASTLALLRPKIMKYGLDGIQTNPHSIMSAGLLLACVIVVEQAVAFPQLYLVQSAGARAMADLRAVVFRFLHTRSLAFFDGLHAVHFVQRPKDETGGCAADLG